MCSIYASKAQWRVYILILCYTHLNLALLLHKTVLVTFLLASTVFIHCKLELGLLGGTQIQTIEIGLVFQGPCCHDVITLSMIILADTTLKTHISSTTIAL